MPHLRPQALTRRPTLVALCVGGALLSSGCTALSGGYVPPVVVTVTPTVTVTPKAAAPAPSTPAPQVKSDDAGKKFDIGRVKDVKDEGGTKVLTLDRVTSRTIPSSRVFAEGLTLEPHSKEIFRQGSSQTYSIPVLPDATFTKLTCVTKDEPAQAASSSLDELRALPGRAGVVLLELDDKGWVRRMTSDPVCS